MLWLEERDRKWVKSKQILGLPWRSSGSGSALPLQGAQVQFLVWEARIPPMPRGTGEINKYKQRKHFSLQVNPMSRPERTQGGEAHAVGRQGGFTLEGEDVPPGLHTHTHTHTHTHSTFGWPLTAQLRAAA